MPGDPYASGNWRVKEGSEQEDTGDPRFVSFSAWEDDGSRDSWKTSSEFASGLASYRELCEDVHVADHSEVASV